MATIKFVLRPSIKAGKHPGSLSVRIIHERKSKTVSIRRHLFFEEWDEAAQTVIYPVDNPFRKDYLKEVQERIAGCGEKIEGIIRRLEGKRPYTADEIIALYSSETGKGKLTGFAAVLARELVEKRQIRTARAYISVCRRLVAFNNGVDIPLERINGSLIKNFESFLKENGKQPNTISYYMRNLRAIYNKAVSTGRIRHAEKPFSGVYTGVEETKKRALSAEEINRIGAIDFDELLQEHRSGSRQWRCLRSLACSRRLFFFCLFAQGMCFVDMCFLKKSQLKGNVVRYYRKKTGRQIEVPVNEGMRMIIDSFAEETACSDYLFPVLSGADDNPRRRYETALRSQNRRLKKLTGLAGLDKNLATHVARHSWASILKNKMTPLSVISEGLGHSSEKMTRKYLAAFEHSILDNAGKTLFSVITKPANSKSVYLQCVSATKTGRKEPISRQ